MLDPGNPQADEILTVAADTGRFLQGEWLPSTFNPQHSPGLIAKAAYHGFLPMSSGRRLMLKLHFSRCMFAPETVHIGRQSRKKAAQFRLSIDKAFSEVVKGVQQHTWTNQPGDCWLHDEIAGMYEAVSRLPDVVRRGVAFHSVELWHRESGRLVAGEIGYTVGAIYSSCTGFALKDEFPGSGTLQLVALARLLEKRGFRLWDLGMGMDYKTQLGGKMQSRASWVASVRALRDLPLVLSSPEEILTMKDLLAVSAEQEAAEDAEAAAKGMQLLLAALTPTAAAHAASLTPTSRVIQGSLALQAAGPRNAFGMSGAHRTGGNTAPQDTTISTEAVSMLTTMGFPEAEVRRALQTTRGDRDRAVAVLLGDQ